MTSKDTILYKARNRSIFAAATEGVSKELLYALDRTKLFKRLSELRRKVFPQGSTDPASLVIREAWMKHVDGSPFTRFLQYCKKH
uniref:Uncharacterized protein n=1 Tax=Ditylenchus dipsaci TaxID=166011 RepID=A0A915DBP7_9BILA